MQGQARFAWRKGKSRAGESPLARRQPAGLPSLKKKVLPCEATDCQKPTANSTSASFQSLAQAASKGLLEGFCPEPPQEEELAFNSNGLMLFVRLADIEWMRATGDCVELRVGPRTYRLRATLAALAARLPPGRFLPVGSSTLVNLNLLEPSCSN